MAGRTMTRLSPVPRVVAFVLVFCALYVLFYLLRGGPVERLVIHDATVTPAAVLARILEPATGAHPIGNRIYSAQGSLVVQNGCEGVETLFMLWAAIAAFPAGVRAKCAGIAWGTLLVYGLNQLRLVALFLVSHHSKPVFEALHGYVAPTLIVLLVGVFFVGWTGQISASPHEPAAPG